MTTANSIDFAKLREPFPAADVEWRIGQSGSKADGTCWAKVLAYITNRAIMQRLDEVCGPENWQNEYRTAPNASDKHKGVICGISIRVNGEWITKWDGADSTDIEEIKGGLSDSMKRAGVQWGIGRYLYDLEEGWADVSKERKNGARFAKTKDGKEFYWLPPTLPSWALPTVKQPPANGKKPPEKKPEPAKLDPVKELKRVLNKQCGCKDAVEANAVIYYISEHAYSGLEQATATPEDAQIVLDALRKANDSGESRYDRMLAAAHLDLETTAAF